MFAHDLSKMRQKCPEFKTPPTLHRFQMKTVLFCSVFKTIPVHTNRFRIVFVSFSPVHTTTRIRIENAVKPYILL